jgi:hypothetical protein
MLLGVPLSELFWLALAIIIAGVITGLLAGLFGIGGGAIIVPVLYEVFRLLGVSDEVRMQLCIGTSIAIIVPTTIRSYLTHREKGLVSSRRDTGVDGARGTWRRLRCDYRRACPRGGVQDRVRRDRDLHCKQISIRG